MPFPIFEARVTAVVGADGTATINVLSCPNDRVYILSLDISAPNSAGGAARVVMNGYNLITAPSINGLVTGIRVNQSGNLQIIASNCEVGDTITVSPFGESYVGPEVRDAPMPAPNASSAVDFAQQALVASGVITAGNQEITLVTPGPGQKVTITDYFTDVPFDVEHGGGAQDVQLQLRDITLGVNKTTLRRFYAPTTAATTPGGSCPWGQELSSGTTFPVGSSVGARLGAVLTQGDVLVRLGYVLIGG